jgi:hypothetical protein
VAELAARSFCSCSPPQQLIPGGRQPAGLQPLTRSGPGAS